ncbi:MAG: tRNA preQ1(34) S-adenosylmethionine ribosyltransferase-isomerase QueA [Omnitrophica bacterium]|nr:tRNA preQ1(34) S-adenosylmethionine ribosyltransferase-isomerase QueA [Candidatus Omnitrophota bacterium]
MKLSEFDYEVPRELIAQYPSGRRGDDRLLVVDRRKGSFEERHFSDIADYFASGDLLALNDTKVIPARLFGKRKTGGKVEIFVLDRTERPARALVRSSGRIKPGETVTLNSGYEVKVLGAARVGRLVEFNEPVDEVLRRCGHVPLPPYISRPDEPSDRERYQTIYASADGATASPTAGLHFTENAVRQLKEKGVEIAYVTLHVSYGTFAPIKEDTVEKHKMHSEHFHVSKENAEAINGARGKKARIFACGTTSLRTLEARAEDFKNPISERIEGRTDLFIYPGYKFKIVDALITNFHLPKSTLLLLTSAFAGKELLFRAYEYAIKNKFKFFSYGDAMLIM